MKIMNKFILFSTLFFNSLFAVAEFPTWVERNTKLQAYDQLAEWSKEIGPYKMGEVLIKVDKTTTGDVTQNVEIKLDDLGNCKQRKLETSCLPVGLHTSSPAMFCRSSLSDCSERNISKMTLVK
ncbi:MAG: hypothetical protein A2622_05945 [Bdellovibrionales bacterium RIFCSPHIGHO2_01_FULL_40_29]|nr:MAG: hypothetical protein A2622_05945 [Bdellovibrionales bacterium RIFCSPHIGHO2_01_FULL_40_29]OFZ34995.1 MAG: hypothetical protein A3D17_06295 [Bdellovibrionales bacterium RIFCSPHIGHO2_02_FULL_40_15]